MMRFLLTVTIIAGSLFTANTSEACNRCGLFGRGCRYSYGYNYYPTYYQPVQYQPPISNFVFNNTYPVPYLAQSGNTAYGQAVSGGANGYSMSALPYQVDVAGGFDRAGRLAEVAFQGGHEVMTQFNASLQNAAAVNEASTRRAQIAAVTAEGIRAMAINPPNTQPPPTMNFSATMQGGQLRVNPPTPAGIAPNPQMLMQPGYTDPASAVGQQYGVGYNVCATCHDGAGTHNEPKELVYNGSRNIDPSDFGKAALSIELGKMPPVSTGIRLSPQDKAIVLTELAKMVVAQPVPQVQPPAPPSGPVSPYGGGQIR